MKKLLLIGILSCLLIGFSFALSSKAPDFILKDLSGKTVKLSDYKGKVVFLNFFATWCPPCREEMPSIQKLQSFINKSKIVVLTVSVDQNNDAGVRSFIEKGGYTFKVLLDGSGNISNKYGVRGIPATFIIDKKGSLISSDVGARDWSDPKVIEQLKALSSK